MEYVREIFVNLVKQGYLPEFFEYAFVINSLLASLIIAPILGGIGTMVLIKRMAFFSEAIGHAALTGISLGIIFGENIDRPYISLFAYCLIFSIIINYTRNRTKMGTDTLIGIFLSISISIGAILVIYVSSKASVDMLETILFGSILTVSDFDLFILFLSGIILFFIIYFTYNKIILSSFNPILAEVKGVNVILLDYIFIIIITIITVASVKIIGAALVEALLLIPASSAKNISKSLKSFVVYSIIFSLISCLLGIFIPLIFEISIPSGPAIILVSAIIFFITMIIKNISNKFKEGVY